MTDAHAMICCCIFVRGPLPVGGSLCVDELRSYPRPFAPNPYFRPKIGHIMFDIYVFLFGETAAQLAIAPLVIVGAVAAAASIGNALFGAASARKEKQRQERMYNRAILDNENWYKRRYNEDATARADAQAAMTRANEANARRTRAARGRKAVVGGTDASMASVQRANAKAVGDALANITVNAQSRKDNIEAQYRQRDSDLRARKSDALAAASQVERQNTAAAATGLINAAANVAAASAGGSSTGAAAKGGIGITASDAAAMSKSVRGTPLPDQIMYNNSYKSLFDSNYYQA